MDKKLETLRERRRHTDREYISNNLLAPGSFNRSILDTLMGINHLVTSPMRYSEPPNTPDLQQLGQALPQINNTAIYQPNPNANLSTNVEDRRSQYSPIVLQGLNKYYPNPLNYLMRK